MNGFSIMLKVFSASLFSFSHLIAPLVHHVQSFLHKSGFYLLIFILKICINIHERSLQFSFLSFFLFFFFFCTVVGFGFRIILHSWDELGSVHSFIFSGINCGHQCSPCLDFLHY